MEDNYESAIDEMLNELNDLKESSVELNANSLSRSQVNVLSTSLDKIVIEINLKQNDETNDSSVDRENDQNKDDSNNSEEPDDGSDGKSSANNCSPKGQKSASDSKNSKKTTCNTSEQKFNRFKGRSLGRTISESNSEVLTRGILKYPHNWNRRTVSESSCDFTNTEYDQYSDHYTSIEEIFSEDDLYSDDKPKKNVRFNDCVSKTIFRANSSILGRKSKNQKRAKNRKNSKYNSELSKSQEDCNGKTTRPNKIENNDKQLESQRSRQDSGYDSEDIGHENVKLDNRSYNKTHKQNNRIEIETGISQSDE